MTWQTLEGLRHRIAQIERNMAALEDMGDQADSEVMRNHRDSLRWLRWQEKRHLRTLDLMERHWTP